MSVIFIALPVTLLLACGFVIAFVWCARKGQFDDLETPAIRILFEDEPDRAGTAEDRETRQRESPSPSPGTLGE